MTVKPKLTQIRDAGEMFNVHKMPCMRTISAFQLADSINIRTFKSDFMDAQLLYSNEQELFYQINPDEFISVFNYGAVCYYNIEEDVITGFKGLLTPYCTNIHERIYRERMQVNVNSNAVIFGFNKIEIINADKEILRLIMLNLAQSIALTYYFQTIKELLDQTTHYTSFLEFKGKLGISNRELKRFIGKILNLKNQIISNLYILDAPPGSLYDENLKKIDAGLKISLNMQTRSGNVHEELKIIKEHLSLFSDIMHHKTSIMLEWIIVLLVGVEVANLIITKLF